MNCAIEVEGLTKRFGEVSALDGVDFAVPEGSVCGFLGPNGAGKTTTLKILLGLLSPTAGKAKLFGKDVPTNQTAEFKRQVGYLPQDPVFPGRMTALEVLRFVADTYHIGDAANRIDELLNRFDLSDAAKREVSEYSRGMKQRLGLASALLPSPRLLLLDEPVSALDPEGRFEVLELISSMRGECTVFFSTHILADVERTCDRVIMIHKGKVVAQELLETLLQRYSTEQYVLRVEDGQRERALEIVRSLPSVKEATYENGGSSTMGGSTNRGGAIDGGAIRVSAVHGQLGELRRSVVKQMAQADIMVIDFHLIKRSLESIFLDVVAASSEVTER